jgi:prepilin-type N-terminal cleavage/methylation domain-containing protein
LIFVQDSPYLIDHCPVTYLLLKMKNQKPRRKGFTLIELLVVITIIGILAGIAIGAFGGIFGQAGQLAAKDKLMDIHKAIVQAYKGQAKFPTNLDDQSPAGFAEWFAKKTRNPEVSYWYIDEDDKVLALEEDGGAGKPTSMTGNLDQDQKDAIAWVIALPTADDASPKLDQNLRSGPFPIMWTRGLSGTEWDADSPWSGDGGHVLFSNGKVEWYESTDNDGVGVFLKPPAEDADEDTELEQVSDPEDALPDGWEIIGGGN